MVKCCRYITIQDMQQIHNCIMLKLEPILQQVIIKIDHSSAMNVHRVSIEIMISNVTREYILL